MSDGVLGLFINPVTLSPTGADLTTLNVKSDQLGFLGGSVVKNLPANAGDSVRFLGRENALEKETATHSSVLTWEIP